MITVNYQRIYFYFELITGYLRRTDVNYGQQSKNANKSTSYTENSQKEMLDYNYGKKNVTLSI